MIGTDNKRDTESGNCVLRTGFNDNVVIICTKSNFLFLREYSDYYFYLSSLLYSQCFDRCLLRPSLGVSYQIRKATQNFELNLLFYSTEVDCSNLVKHDRYKCFCYNCAIWKLFEWNRLEVAVSILTIRILTILTILLQSRYYVHFRANTLGKGMNPLILPPAMDK